MGKRKHSSGGNGLQEGPEIRKACQDQETEPLSWLEPEERSCEGFVLFCFKVYVFKATLWLLVDSGLEGTKGNTGSPTEGCFSIPAEREQ